MYNNDIMIRMNFILRSCRAKHMWNTHLKTTDTYRYVPRPTDNICEVCANVLISESKPYDHNMYLLMQGKIERIEKRKLQEIQDIQNRQIYSNADNIQPLYRRDASGMTDTMKHDYIIRQGYSRY